MGYFNDEKFLFKLALIAFFLVSNYFVYAQEQKGYFNNQTPAYNEIIQTYQELDKKNENASLIEIGETDIGKPLHLFIISNDGDFDPISIHKKDRRIIFINNGIHPGESCGIDASIQFVSDLLSGKLKSNEILKNTVFCIVPVYNIGGCLNRNSTSRQNQNGPELHGYRGNAKNLDLNRDFIKCDSKNAKSLVGAFHQWNPDVYIDTHSSNGADYQYVITLVTNQPDKMNPSLASFMNKNMLPFIYGFMNKADYEMTPYVESMNWNNPPDSGIVAFFDNSRYAIGFAGLFNTFAFFTETHMLKPYKERVLSTYQFILGMSEFVAQEDAQIKKIRKKAVDDTEKQSVFALKWSLDLSKKSKLNFKGYAAKTKKSEVTGLTRLYYDRNEPFEKHVDYYPHFKIDKEINKPAYYIIPQAYTDVIERLSLNNILYTKLEKDTSIEVECYYIQGFKTREAYENHYMHYNVEVEPENQKVRFYKGDFVVKTNQSGNKYIIEVLEPESDDSFFAWNFFDGCLQKKEWFSPYIFEETAKKIIESQPEIKKALAEAIRQNPEMAKNDYAQLAFIYEKGIKYNEMYNRYPVFRLNKEILLPTK